jgi:hypothetical protein
MIGRGLPEEGKDRADAIQQGYYYGEVSTSQYAIWQQPPAMLLAFSGDIALLDDMIPFRRKTTLASGVSSLRGSRHPDPALATKDKQTIERRRLRALSRVIRRVGPEPLTRPAMLLLWRDYARSLSRPTAGQRTMFLDILRRVESLRTGAGRR